MTLSDPEAPGGCQEDHRAEMLHANLINPTPPPPQVIVSASAMWMICFITFREKRITKDAFLHCFCIFFFFSFSLKHRNMQKPISRQLMKPLSLFKMFISDNRKSGKTTLHQTCSVSRCVVGVRKEVDAGKAGKKERKQLTLLRFHSLQPYATNCLHDTIFITD